MLILSGILAPPGSAYGMETAIHGNFVTTAFLRSIYLSVCLWFDSHVSTFYGIRIRKFVGVPRDEICFKNILGILTGVVDILLKDGDIQLPFRFVIHRNDR